MLYDSGEAKKVLKYIKEKYDTEPEFLWAKSNNAIFRHKDNKKWFGAILNIQKNKLGISGEGYINILDLKCDSLLKDTVIDKKRYFPGYHMNKEYWITIILDGTVPINDIFYFIDLSYELTKR